LTPRASRGLIPETPWGAAPPSGLIPAAALPPRVFATGAEGPGANFRGPGGPNWVFAPSPEGRG